MDPEPLIYALSDSAGEIRYIGKTTIGIKRKHGHSYTYRTGKRGNPYLINWFNQLKARGENFAFVVLERPCLDGLDEAEIRWIAEGRSRGWRLCNITEGGDGGLRGPEQRELMKARELGKWANPEYKARVTASIRRSQAERKGLTVEEWERHKADALQAKELRKATRRANAAAKRTASENWKKKREGEAALIQNIVDLKLAGKTKKQIAEIIGVSFDRVDYLWWKITRVEVVAKG